MSQTSYAYDPAIAVAGQLADLAHSYVRSAVNEEASAIPFGVAVKKGTGDNDIKLPTAADDDIIGVVAHNHAHDPFSSGVSSGVEANGSASLLASGPAYVQVEEAVAAGDEVYVRIADGVADPTKTQKGSFRRSADTATAIRVRGARYLTSAAAGAFAIIWFDALANRSLQVITADIEDDAVTTAKIAAGAVDTTELADDAVTAAKLDSDAVVTASIVDANVTTAKLADNNVTPAKLALEDAQGLAPALVVSVEVAAGIAGGADDVDLGVLGIKARILDTHILVGTAGAGGSVATLRDAAAGGGNALSDSLSTAATGVVRNASITAPPEIAATDNLYVRRSDDSAAFTIVMLLAPIA